jgi:hypothetical protein
MELETLLTTATPTALAYFIVGGVIGYLLRMYQPAFRNNRPGRYGTKKSDATKRTASLAELNEPTFALPKSLSANKVDEQTALLGMEARKI